MFHAVSWQDGMGPDTGLSAIHRLFEVISVKYGLDPDAEKKEAAIMLLKRKAAQTQTALPLFVDRLMANSEDQHWHELIFEITRQDHSFFENKSQFEYLKRVAIPAVVKRRKLLGGGDQVKPRMLCLGSATGEEAYSMSMTGLEANVDRESWSVQVDAWDISQVAIERARQGIFDGGPAEVAVSKMDSSYLRKYFVQQGRKIAVDPKVRSKTSFRRINIKVLFDHPTFHLQKFDVIFFRRRLADYHAQDQRSIIRLLEGFLLPGGYLFLGPAEALSDFHHGLVLVEDKDGMIYRKPDFTAQG